VSPIQRFTSLSTGARADLGVRMATIGNTLRPGGGAGDDRISFYKEGRSRYPVKVRVLENQRRDARRSVGDGAVGENRPRCASQHRADRAGLGPSTAARSNRQFTVQLTGDVAPGTRWTKASNDIRKMFAGLNIPAICRSALQGQSKILTRRRQHDHGDRPGDIFVYMVLASQFESFIQPIVIHSCAADCGAVRAVHAVGDRADAEPVERARCCCCWGS